MAKGQEEKQIIATKILETFPNSFIVDKDIRIPINGLEIKVSLTCAKDVIGAGGGVVDNGSPISTTSEAPASLEPTQAELDAVTKLMEKLNL